MHSKWKQKKYQIHSVACALKDANSANDFYRAMLCIRGTSHGPVSVSLCLSVRLSQVGVLLKQNAQDHTYNTT